MDTSYSTDPDYLKRAQIDSDWGGSLPFKQTVERQLVAQTSALISIAQTMREIRNLLKDQRDTQVTTPPGILGEIEYIEQVSNLQIHQQDDDQIVRQMLSELPPGWTQGALPDDYGFKLIKKTMREGSQ